MSHRYCPLAITRNPVRRGQTGHRCRNDGTVFDLAGLLKIPRVPHEVWLNTLLHVQRVGAV